MHKGGEDTDARRRGKERERTGPLPFHSSSLKGYPQSGATGQEQPTVGSIGREGERGYLPGCTLNPEDLQLQEV